MKKNIAIFGSTGFIGQACLDVVSFFSEKFTVFGLVANKQKELFLQQIKKFQPRFAVFSDEEYRSEKNSGETIFLYGKEGLEFLAQHNDVDIVVMAISGLAGLKPTFKALEAGKTVALATKEIMVCAGHLLGEKKRKILPVDSEHNAIFQILNAEKKHVKKIILTASGGPFLSYSGDISNAKIDEVLNHPVWKMGRRISVDSATMMNKGLEVIEAYYLFDVEKENLDVVIHPQAIIHGLVAFQDGFVKAVLSNPDMRYSLSYCLSFPERFYSGLPEFDIRKLGTLTFDEIKKGKFPCFDLAKEALDKGGSYLTALNAADDECVNLFLEGRIKFGSIPLLVEKVLDKHNSIDLKNVDDVLHLDMEIRQQVRIFAEKFKN